jgi:hypothetical protein
MIARPISLLILPASILFIATSSTLAQDWKPVDPAHLALKSPVVDKDADAEAIFWEVRVQDEIDGSSPQTVLRHYVRIKIFTERGKEAQSKIDIAYPNTHKISDIAGRTIKPDGTIVELKKDGIFQRTVAKAGKLKLQAKSFAMPAVEPGSIIEYRWREVRGDQIAFYLRLYFQRDIPVQLVKYYLKPISLPGFPFGMRSLTFHAKFSQFQKERDGFYSCQMTNVPAFKEEPRMPPEDQVRPWMLVYYSKDRKLSPAQFWKEYGKEVYENHKGSMKPNDEVKRAATEIVGDATTPERKLERLYDFCRTKIKNIYADEVVMSDDDRKKIKDNKSPADTLKRGMGTGIDIDMLFGALASALGYEVRVAHLADRSDIFFDPNLPDDYFLNASVIAVMVGERWRFYDTSAVYLPAGMLPWYYEGQQALISDPKEPVFVGTPMSAPEKSVMKRVAKLRLADDGTLEGEVRMEYTGHLGADRKEYDDDDSADQREKTLFDRIRERMSTAELRNIKIENITDNSKPFVYSFQVRVPGYAQRTGRRLFLQPAFFQKGFGALFPTSQRTHDVYFHHPWSEDDTVEIELPPGFTLDSADSPSPFTIGQLGKYDVGISASGDGRIIQHRRTFSFGAQGMLLFPQKSYSQLKMAFDALHERDNHTLTLKQGGGNQ